MGWQPIIIPSARVFITAHSNCQAACKHHAAHAQQSLQRASMLEENPIQ